MLWATHSQHQTQLALHANSTRPLQLPGAALHLLQALGHDFKHVLAEPLHCSNAAQLRHHHGLALLVVLHEGGEGARDAAGHLVVDLVHLAAARAGPGGTAAGARAGKVSKQRITSGPLKLQRATPSRPCGDASEYKMTVQPVVLSGVLLHQPNTSRQCQVAAAAHTLITESPMNS